MPLSPLILNKFYLFHDLTEAELSELGNHMSVRNFERREVIYNKGEGGQFFYFLIDGRLQSIDFTIDGREVGLYFTEPYDFVGELSVVDGGPHQESLISVSKSSVAFLPISVARRFMAESVLISGRLMVRLAKKLRQASEHRSILSLSNPTQRVCAQLTQIVSTDSSGDILIKYAPTHQEIAIMVDTSRETVTRTFQKLQAKNILKRFDSSTFTVMNLKFLESVAAGSVTLA